MSRILPILVILITIFAIPSTSYTQLQFSQLCPNSKVQTCFRHQLAEAQVKAKFEEKFALVTSDIQKQSDENLSALEVAFKQFRAYELFRNQAEAIAHEDNQNMVLLHSTSTDSATAILKSEAILSADELVRRKIRPLEQKGQASTLIETDGQIGEQDVVYLALQPTTTQPGFGEVTFSFDKSAVIDSGYFTLNSFTVGSNSTVTSEVSAAELNQMVNEYRPMIFKGYQTFLKLLAFSEANELWLEKQPWLKNTFDGLKNYNQDSEARNLVSLKNHKTPIKSLEELNFPVCTFLTQLNQLTAGDCSNNSNVFNVSRILSNISDYSEQSATSEKAIRSFAFFPNFGTSRLPLSTRGTHWFWEVKVPRTLSLQSLKSVSFRTTREMHFLKSNNQEVVTIEPIDTKDLEGAIVAYATKHNLTFFRSKKSENEEVYDFGKM